MSIAIWRETLSWLFLLLEVIVLGAVALWPRVSGKGWLVASVSVTLFRAIYFRGLHVLVHYFSEEPNLRLYREFEVLHFVVECTGIVASICLVVAVIKLTAELQSAKETTNQANTNLVTSGLPNIQLLPTTPPATRARILLRLGSHSTAVREALQSIGISENEAKSLVASQLELLRRSAVSLLAAGAAIAVIALFANVVSLSEYSELRSQRLFVSRTVWFYPIPMLIGIVLAGNGIARLSRLK